MSSKGDYHRKEKICRRDEVKNSLSRAKEFLILLLVEIQHDDELSEKSRLH